MSMYRNVIVSAFILLMASFVVNAQTMSQGVAKVATATGNVIATNATTGESAPIKSGDSVVEGQTVVTGLDGTAILLFSNGSAVTLKPGSSMTIQEFKQEPITEKIDDFSKLEGEPTSSLTDLRVNHGSVVGDVKKLSSSSKYNISSPIGTAGIRGTIWLYEIDKVEEEASVIPAWADEYAASQIPSMTHMFQALTVAQGGGNGTFGIAEGSANFTDNNGNSGNVGAGQQFRTSFTPGPGNTGGGNQGGGDDGSTGGDDGTGGGDSGGLQTETMPAETQQQATETANNASNSFSGFSSEGFGTGQGTGEGEGQGQGAGEGDGEENTETTTTTTPEIPADNQQQQEIYIPNTVGGEDSGETSQAPVATP